MANEVFANGMEVSCKAAQGKSVACFPDVCFTPPQAPPTPMGVPIPYPNTGMSKDTTNGTRSVKITGKEVMLKDRSYFKTSYGDEAGCAPKKGVITSRNKGKVYFTAWSMNVKFEGLNVVRHMDLTTHNHASQPGNTPPWIYADSMTSGDKDPCAGDRAKQENDCKGYKPNEACSAALPSRKKESGEAHSLADQIAADKCLAAMRCTLRPYEPPKEDKDAGNACCPSQTPHHLIEASAVHESGRSGTTLAGVSDTYRAGKALSICAEGQTQYTGTHGLLHTFQSAKAAGAPVKALKTSTGGTVEAPATTYGKARDSAVEAVGQTFPESSCDEQCLKHQLDYYHKRQGMSDGTEIKAVQTGNYSSNDVSAATARVAERTDAIHAMRNAHVGGSR
ncbi:PAAR-like domain-containing protein [Pseudomonas sp. LRF_L74]|uniref:PAAR-like domain-containing protein n=1 Tax=Pseudomonas sp. LRF_L74 TaxID=3369422 RepID=UPI003F62EBDB